VPGALRALGIFEPVPGQELSPAKVRLLIYGSLWEHVLNCLVFCNFVSLLPNQMDGLIRGITGWDIDVRELMKVGERCVNMTRTFNMRQGMSKDDDYLPPRFFIPFASGPLKEVNINKGELDQAINTYYAMVGWDKNGAPTSAKLQELGIEWLAGYVNQ